MNIKHVRKYYDNLVVVVTAKNRLKNLVYSWAGIFGDFVYKLY